MPGSIGCCVPSSSSCSRLGEACEAAELAAMEAAVEVVAEEGATAAKL